MGRKALTALRRQEILKEYYLLVLEEGLEGASTVKLARRMGTSSSLLMHYFSSKDDLLRSLVAWISEAYEARFLPALAQQPSPAARFCYLLDALFSAEWDNLIDGRIFYALYPLIFRHPEVRKRFRENFQIFHRHLERELAAAAEAGLIHVASPARTAHLIINLVEGFNFHNRILGSEAEFRQQAAEMRELLLKVCNFSAPGHL